MPEILPAASRAVALAQDTSGQAEARVRAVALQIGYQLPADCADPDLIQRDIAANMRRSVEACLQVGQGLRVLKEACPHGSFIARLDVLGLERNVAARFMQAASKFSNAPTSAHLIKAIGTQSKLLEMLVLDDEQIEELELTGQSGELKLDDVATMSVKELRAALRQEKQSTAFEIEKRASAEQRADKAEKRLRGKVPEVLPLSERITPFQIEITERQSLLEKALIAHAEAATALDAWWTEEATATEGYDPTQQQPLPPAVLAVAQHLFDGIERTAAMVGALQAQLHDLFGDEIASARQHLLQTPADEAAGA